LLPIPTPDDIDTIVKELDVDSSKKLDFEEMKPVIRKILELMIKQFDPENTLYKSNRVTYA
jgi:hypothetical protein